MQGITGKKPQSAAPKRKRMIPRRTSSTAVNGLYLEKIMNERAWYPRIENRGGHAIREGETLQTEKARSYLIREEEGT